MVQLARWIIWRNGKHPRCSTSKRICTIYTRLQYIQQVIRRDRNNIDEILTAPEGQDEVVWEYEHLRQFCMELNGLAVRLQEQCTPQSCPQMIATEQWIFLCAAHKTPREVRFLTITTTLIQLSAIYKWTFLMATSQMLCIECSSSTCWQS